MMRGCPLVMICHKHSIIDVFVGLTDDVRSDFNVMKDLAVHTRVGPEQRAKSLTSFVNAMNKNADVHREMGGWGLKFAETLIQFNGRVVPPEKIKQAGAPVSKCYVKIYKDVSS